MNKTNHGFQVLATRNGRVIMTRVKHSAEEALAECRIIEALGYEASVSPVR